MIGVESPGQIQGINMKHLPTSELEIWDEIKYVWNIENLSNLTDINYSPEFEVAGAKWNLYVYPTGAGSLRFYLKCVDSSQGQRLGWSRYTIFAIVVVNSKNHNLEYLSDIDYTQFDCESPAWGIDDAIKVSDLVSLNIMEDDAVSVILELRVFKSRRRIGRIQHQQDFATKANAWASEAAEMGFDINLVPMEIHPSLLQPKPYVNSPIGADFALVMYIDEFYDITERTFYAHKKVLGASSKYFEAMFNRDSGFKESSEFTVKIELPLTLSLAEMMSVLHFAYTGSLDGPWKDLDSDDNDNESDGDEPDGSEHADGSNDSEDSDYQDNSDVSEDMSDDSKESEAPNTSNNCCLLRLALIAEYLQMDSLLACLCEKLVKVGGSSFASKMECLEGKMISAGILSNLLTLCAEGESPLRRMLQWLDLTVSSHDRPQGWDQTPEGLEQLKNLIDTFVVPEANETSLAKIPHAFAGISNKLLHNLPINSVLPSILNN